MHLKSLEISGFKSFAKKAVLEFNFPITAIVGPNGSGKSNVAEAFRFVLGEQSIKSLRGKRGEDLIFNGGKSQSRLNRASVKVAFNNRNRILKIDFDEVSLERVVHRDSANEYFINGSPARLKDIIELLAGAHIGASGHHIISQGEADRILNASLKERREMIEEALGLKVYHYKREESLRKLEKTEENLKEANSLRKEIAPHIKFLEKQVEKIEKTREMRADLEKLYREYFKREDIYIKFEKSRLAEEKKAPDQRLKELEKELTEARNILSRSSDRDAKSNELLALESKIQNLRSERNDITREIGKLEGQIASEERILRKQQELATSNEMKTVMLRDVESIASSVYREVEEAEKAEDPNTFKTILYKIKNLISDFIAHNKNQTDSLNIRESEEEIEKLKKERVSYDEKLESLTLREKDCNSEYSKLQREIEKEKDTSRDAEKAVFRIMAEQNETISKLNQIKNQEERLHSLDEEMKRELQEGAALVGRSVFDFGQSAVTTKEGWQISDEKIIEEPRHEQEERRKVIERIKIRLEDSGTGSGEDIVKEYDETKGRDTFLAREIEDLQKSAETLQTLIKDLEERLLTEFKTGVEKINKQFQEYFSLMFGGGSATLHVIRETKRRRKSEEELIGQDEDEEEFVEEEGEEGIDINVNLPQKRVKGLMMLSGGERALTSIALLFAISQVNPPPFIILDETDAALDEANSRKYGDMIDNLSKYSQLILITHNRETMSRASVLYGVTMSSEGFSKLLSIKFDEAVAVAK
jgi:chromosome segregation ATPase